MKVESGLLGVAESMEALTNFVETESRAIVDALEFFLREMVNYVKVNGPWTDRTTNLRNSISCNIDTMQEWPSDVPPEKLTSLVKQNETPVVEIQGDTFTGVLSAGMEYAIWVELKDGYWVLTGAIDKFEPLIEQYFSGKMAVEKLDLISVADIQYSKYLSKKGYNDADIDARIQQKHDYYNNR